MCDGLTGLNLKGGTHATQTSWTQLEARLPRTRQQNTPPQHRRRTTGGHQTMNIIWIDRYVMLVLGPLLLAKYGVHGHEMRSWN